jgi:hypothetical protein
MLRPSDVEPSAEFRLKFVELQKAPAFELADGPLTSGSSPVLPFVPRKALLSAMTRSPTMTASARWMQARDSLLSDTAVGGDHADVLRGRSASSIALWMQRVKRERTLVACALLRHSRKTLPMRGQFVSDQTWPRYASTAKRLAAAMLVGVLAGCQSLYLHSDTRQKQAEVASKAWSEVDLDAALTTEQENLAKLAAAEYATQARVAESIRSFTAVRVVSAPTVQSGVIEASDKQLRKLVRSQADLDAVMKKRDALILPASQLAATTADLAEAASPIQDCAHLNNGKLPDSAAAWVAGRTAASRVFLSQSLDRLVVQCEQVKDLEEAALAEERTRLAGSAFDDALQQLDADRKQLDAKRAEFGPLKAQYQDALANYKHVLEAATPKPDDQTLTANVKAAAERVKKALDALGAINNAFAKKFVAEESLASADAAISMVIDSSGKEAPADASKLVVLTVELPAIMDRYRAASAEAKKPLVLPLLLRRNYEQIRLDAATTDAKGLEAKVAVSEEIVSSIRTEASALDKAIKELNGSDEAAMSQLTSQPFLKALDHSCTAAAPAAKPVAKAAGRLTVTALAPSIDDTCKRQKQLLWSGIARYLDAIGRLDGERYRLEYKRIAVDHERSLAYSKSSVDQWKNLIGSGVDQMKSFADGGVSKELLADIAKILSFLWIGHGVNK